MAALANMNKRIWIAASVLVLAMLVAWFLWDRTSTPSLAKASAPMASPAPAEVDVLRYPAGAPQLSLMRAQPLGSSPIPLTDPLSARLVYDEDVTARIAVGISGRITAIKAAPGDLVRAGQVLAEIDSPDFGTAQADLNKASADEDRKQRAVERAKELVPGEALPVREWEGLQADLAQAHAETARAQQRIRNLNPRGLPIVGQRLSLTSPIDGVVTDRTATQALEVSPSLVAPLFVVTDPRHLWVLIDVPEKILGRIRLGSKVEVQSDAFPDQTFMARIVQLGQVVDANTRRVTVRARLDNIDRKLLPEMFVRANVLQDSGLGVRVANGAIVNQGLYSYVFVQTGEGAFQRRRVSLARQGSDASYVTEGLKDKERVVTTGALLLDGELTARAGEKP